MGIRSSVEIHPTDTTEPRFVMNMHYFGVTIFFGFVWCCAFVFFALPMWLKAFVVSMAAFVLLAVTYFRH